MLDGHVGGEFTLFGAGGILLIGFHCVGMCGPLIMSFRFGSEGSRFQRTMHASTQLITYQLGRLLVYTIAGALIGTVGLAFQEQLKNVANILALIMAAVFLLVGLHHLGLLGIRWNSKGKQPNWMNKALRSVLDRWRDQPYSRAFCLGIVMAFLPCMLVFWCLGLAASSSHPFDGALLMALLVAMTTPVLLLAAVAPMLISRWQSFLRDRVSPYAILFSAGWLLLIGLAANGLIEHRYLQFGQWTIMFW